MLSNSQLATDLYRQLARQDQNFVFSPYAVSSALAEVASGATGITALQAGRHPAPAGRTTTCQSGLNTLAQQIATRDGDRQNDVRQGQVTIEIPVALWGQLDTLVEPPFLDELARWFGTGMRLVDFRSDPDSARTAINNWMARPDLVPVRRRWWARARSSEATRLLMTAGASIAAPWDERFDASRTRQAPFHLLDGRTEVATTMSITSPQGLLYAKGPGWQSR